MNNTKTIVYLPNHILKMIKEDEEKMKKEKKAKFFNKGNSVDKETEKQRIEDVIMNIK